MGLISRVSSRTYRCFEISENKMTLLSQDRTTFLFKFGASAISLYAAYNIYKILKAQKSINDLEKAVKELEEKKQKLEAEQSQPKEDACGAGDSCCKTVSTENPSSEKKNAGCCGGGQGEEEEHVFGQA